MLRRGLHFTGSVPASDAGKVVEIERRGQQTGNTWAPTAHGTVASTGSFTAYWPANHMGQFAVRAVIEDQAGSARASAPSPSVTTIVFSPSIATWYGDGSWGSKTACGVTLRRTTLGTANRTLPCGTPVAVYYGGKMIVVPVLHPSWPLRESCRLGSHRGDLAEARHARHRPHRRRVGAEVATGSNPPDRRPARDLTPSRAGGGRARPRRLTLRRRTAPPRPPRPDR